MKYDVGTHCKHPPMHLRFLVLIFLVLAVLYSTGLLGQTGREQNLKTCLTGKYPALCDRSLLTPDQLKSVLEAERRENLSICVTGRFPSLCNHSKVTDAEFKAAREAERQENLQVCLSGRFPSLCNHSLLSPAEAESVRAAERNENLNVCLLLEDELIAEALSFRLTSGGRVFLARLKT